MSTYRGVVYDASVSGRGGGGRSSPPSLYDTSTSTAESGGRTGRSSTGVGAQNAYGRSNLKSRQSPSDSIPSKYQQQDSSYFSSGARRGPDSSFRSTESASDNPNASSEAQSDGRVSSIANRWPHHGSGTPMPSRGGASSASYRQDYSRSQHYRGEPDKFPDEQLDNSMVSVDPPRTWGVQSEPGVREEHDRFSAYINRFAELDPRMDHRYDSQEGVVSQVAHSTTGVPDQHHATRLYNRSLMRQHVQQRRQQAEEKKEEISSQKTNDFSTRGRRLDRNQYPDPEPRLATLEHQNKSSQRRSTSPPGRYTASSRTRDLAKRFEERSQRSANIDSVAQTQSGSTFAASESPSGRTTLTERASRSAARELEMRDAGRPSSLPPVRRQVRQETADPEASKASVGNGRGGERRIRPLQNPAPQVEPSRSALEEMHRHGKHQQRSEIETPEPARVVELQQRLWDTNNRLQVAVPPSLSDDNISPSNDRLNRYEYRKGPDMAAKTAQRAARSLSPKSQRSAHSDSRSGADPKGALFKSRYYEAAERGLASPRSASTSTERRTARGVESPRSRSQHSGGDDAEERKQSYNMEAASSVATRNTAAKSDVASLLARLSAVQRDNPDAALAQIDAILRAESNSSSGGGAIASTKHEASSAGKVDVKEQKPDTDERAPVNDDDDSTSSGETSVSSLTNPTYQMAKAVGDQEVVNLRTASSGHPRPSSLRNYSGHLVESARKDASRKSTRERPVPPGMINVSSKDEGEVSESRRMPSGREGTDKPPEKTTRGQRTSTTVSRLDDHEHKEASEFGHVQSSTQTSSRGSGIDWRLVSRRPASPDFFPSVAPALKAVESAIRPPTPEMFRAESPVLGASPSAGMEATDADELAQKIKRWDQMTTSPVSRESSIRGARPAPQESGPSIERERDLGGDSGAQSTRKARGHPWDATVPAKNGKVDMRETSTESAFGAGVEAEFKTGNPPTTRGRAGFNHHFPTTVEEDFPADEGPLASFGQPLYSPREQEVDRQLRAKRYSAGWDGASRLEPDQQENARNLSDEYDSAWVNLPPSTFFPDSPKQERETSREPARSRGPSRDEEAEYTMQPSRRRGKSLEVQRRPQPTVREREPPFPTRSGSEDVDDGIEVTLVSSEPESKRRGLRGLLKRRSSTKDQVHEHASVVSANSRRSKGQPLLLEKDTDVSSRGRGRTAAKSPKKERPRSLDERRIRNPSIARKFSRLLRVYDDKDLKANF